MDENEFELNGLIYVSKMSHESSCNGCAFDAGCECYADDVTVVPPCVPAHRNDSLDVIFVEKQQ